MPKLDPELRDEVKDYLLRMDATRPNGQTCGIGYIMGCIITQIHGITPMKPVGRLT